MPRLVDHAQRRTEIVYAVWALLAEQGAESVTMRRVAATADVSVGQVQHYFVNKDDLLQQACRAVVDLAATQFDERTRELSALSTVHALLVQPIPQDQVSRVGVAVWQAFLTRAVSDPDIRAIVVSAVAGACERLAELISRAQRDGDLDSALDPTRVARSLFASSYGLAQQVLIGAVEPDEALAATESTLAALRSR